MSKEYYIEKYGVHEKMAEELEQRDKINDDYFDEVCQWSLYIIKERIKAEEQLKCAESILKGGNFHANSRRNI